MKRWIRFDTRRILIASLFLAGLILLIGANAVIYERASREGKDPVTIAPTTPAASTSPAKDGNDGKSAYEIWLSHGYKGTELDFLNSLKGADAVDVSVGDLERAVQLYCAGGVCDGERPTVDQVLQAVSVYCQGNQCKGQDGSNGQSVTPDQVQAAVDDYCANDRCVGAAGTDGQSVKGDSGADGLPGQPGRTPVIGCVIRALNNTTVNYIAWRYEDEEDLAYRNLYQVPTWAQAEGCVDLTGAPV